MKKIKSFLVLLITMGVNYVYSQDNLIMNGSFEEKVTYSVENTEQNMYIQPDGPNQLNLCKHWKAYQSVDYFSRDTINPSNMYSVPKNQFGYQEPRTGNSYAGFVTSYNDYMFQEYLQCKFKRALLKDSTYFLTFYISLSDSAERYGSSLGFLISDKVKLTRVKLTSNMFTDENAKIICGEKFDFKSDSTWEKLSFMYKATGGENFLTIGNFKETYSNKQYKKEFKHFQRNEFNRKSIKSSVYYYIDDVSLEMIVN